MTPDQKGERRLSASKIKTLILEQSSNDSPLKKHPNQVDEGLSSPTPSMLFGDVRQSTPVETAEAVAQMLAMEQKMRRTSTTLGGNEKEDEDLNVRRESSLSPATKKES